MNNPKKLHDEFVRLGGLRHKLKNTMLAILPKIYESGIWKTYADSIVEYAGKYGDIAKTTVIKRLRLEENLENLPYLKAAIEKVGVHKVAMVAKIATPESDEKLAESVLNMSKTAVQSLSKELRAGQSEESVSGGQQLLRLQHGQDQSLIDNQSSPCKAVPITKKIELDEKSTFLFMKLKAKLGKNLTDKEFLKHILEKREKEEFPNRKAKVTEKVISRHGQELRTTRRKSVNVVPAVPASGVTSDVGSVTDDTFPAKPITVDANQNVTGDRNLQISISDYTLAKPTARYIPIRKKRTVIAKTNGKCAYPNCNAPYEILHHTNRYSESRNHDSLIPVCKIHHEFAHNGLIQNETAKIDKWRISAIKPPRAKILQADALYRKYRRKAMC